MLYGWNGAKFSNLREKQSTVYGLIPFPSYQKISKNLNFAKIVKLLTNDNPKFSETCLALARRNSLFWSFFFLFKRWDN